MKKAVCVVLMAVCGFAVASSLNVPWFVDNMAPGAGLQGQTGNIGFVALHNNLQTPITCKIEYYAGDGTKLNYAANANGTGDIHEEWEDSGETPSTGYERRLFVWKNTYNTFVIAPNATVSFRPVKYDPNQASCADPRVTADATALGQEDDASVVIPNRPRYGAQNEGPAPTQTKKQNGACVVSWDGEPTDVQGRYQELSLGMEMSFLLPPGA